MREIKFRVWDVTKTEMLYFDGIFNQHSYTEHSTFPQYESSPQYHTLAIMQFTGLHDKDGKEIYEGDIIALRNWGIRDNEQFGIGSVTWDEWNACWDIEPYQSWLEDRDDFRKCLSCSNIIGNIYETPDLC